MSRSGTAAGVSAGCGCLWVVAIICTNIVFGAWSVNYCLESFLGKTVEFAVAVVAGLFLGEFTVPLAIICWVLRSAGVEAPFMH